MRKCLITFFLLFQTNTYAEVIEMNLSEIKDKDTKIIESVKKNSNLDFSNVSSGFSLKRKKEKDVTPVVKPEIAANNPDLLALDITVKSLINGLDSNDLNNLSSFIKEVKETTWKEARYIVFMGADKDGDVRSQVSTMENNFIAYGIKPEFIDIRLENNKSKSTDLQRKNLIEIMATEG